MLQSMILTGSPGPRGLGWEGCSPTSSLSNWGSVCHAEWPLTPCVTAQTDVTLKPHWQLPEQKAQSQIQEGGGWSKGLWLLGICIEVRSPAANNLTRLRNDGETSLVHSSFHLKQKVLFECKLRSSTLDTPLSQTYSQKINNLSFPEIG